MEGFEILNLAAGEARRFGSPKQLALWQGKPLLQHVIDAVLESGRMPWVALGANLEQIKADSHLSLSKCELIEVHDWQGGMSESIRQGVMGICSGKSDTSGVLVLLADQPCISSGLIETFASEIKAHSECIIATDYANSGKLLNSDVGRDGARSGVPAYFPAHRFSELLSLQGERGAQKVIMRYPHRLVKSENVHVDVDRPEDLNNLQAVPICAKGA